MKHTHRLIALLAALVAPLVHALDLNRTFNLNIPAQSLPAALIELSKQTQLQIMSQGNLARHMTPAITGNYTIAQALKRLLNGTDLWYSATGDNTIAVTPASVSPSVANQVQENMRMADNELSSIAQRNQESGNTAQEEKKTTSLSSDELVTVSESVPEVLVQGSRVLNMDIRRTRDGAQPYIVFDRDALEKSGAANLEAFFRQKLTAATSGDSESQNASILGGTSRINLRGLGSDETLVLVDGRRVAGFSYQGAFRQPDINGIPIAAVERIEVLPATASGIYGGGATGGVVNIVMRRDYNGVETRLTYDNTFNADSTRRRMDISGGTAFFQGKTNVLFSASWSDANPLLTRERDFLVRARTHVLANDPNSILGATIPPLGATTNIRSVSGADLTLKGSNVSLGSAITSVPSGYVGPDSDGGTGLIANAGRFNLELANTAQRNGGANIALGNAPTTKSVTGTLRHLATSSVEIFAEISVSENVGSFANSLASGVFDIAASAPSNPFNERIRVSTPTLGTDQTIESTLKTSRGAVGAIFRLPQEWSMATDFTWNRSTFQSAFSGRLDQAAIAPLVASGVMNVFRDTREFATGFSPYLLPGIHNPPASTTLKDIAIRASGPLHLISFRGTNPRFSFLVEHRDEDLGNFYQITPNSSGLTSATLYPSQAQEVDSVYAEAQVPLVSKKNSIRGVELLELQVAVRHDKYQIHGATSGVVLDSNLMPMGPIIRRNNRLSSSDPTVALRYKPLTDVTLRASFGTGFLPPAVDQLVPSSFQFTSPGSDFSHILDPRRGNEPLGTQVSEITEFSDGAGDLRPERSKSWSGGIVITPRSLADMRVSLDWTRIRKTNNITDVATLTQKDLENELLVPGLIRRNPVPLGDPFEVGPVTGFNVGLFNIARMKAETIDVAIDNRLDLHRFGVIDIAVAATKFISLKTQLTPIAPTVEYVGVGAAGSVGNARDGGALKWKGNIGLTWTRGQLGLGWVTHYFDGYFLNAEHSVVSTQGTAMVPSQLYHDALASYEFSRVNSFSLLNDTVLQFGVKNVLNTRPPVDVVGTGLNSPGYSYYGDPRLASYYIVLRKAF